MIITLSDKDKQSLQNNLEGAFELLDRKDSYAHSAHVGLTNDGHFVYYCYAKTMKSEGAMILVSLSRKNGHVVINVRSSFAGPGTDIGAFVADFYKNYMVWSRIPAVETN